MTLYEVKHLDGETFPQVCVKWANEQQWNAGVTDGVVFPFADPKGMFAGCLDGDEEPIACITAMKYRDNVGFIGYYIVRNPSHRGKNYGLQLFQKAMEYLGPDCNVGLDGVVEQQHNYAKSGFTKVWDNVRFHGKPANDIRIEELPSTFADVSVSMPTIIALWKPSRISRRSTQVVSDRMPFSSHG
ncbi:hypothetical protein BC829DRAFT_222080 [Chytridium lagenaria]|nr:hypothetical protein BC829DRAFT_222080 [Chytridium lagenaria]